MQIGILESQDFSDKAINELKLLGHVSFYENGNISDFIKDKKIIFVRLKYFLGKDLLENAINLKYICTPTTGLNHLDLNYLKHKNIKVVSLKGESKFLTDIRATPEHTFGLILSLLRNYKNAFSSSKKLLNRDLYKGNEIFQNSIGIIGFGRVGTLLAKYIEVFGGNSFFYDTDNTKKEIHKSKKIGSIEELISKCNIICLCASYELSNHEFFDKKYIDLLKDKYFINTSRGELVDELYLIKKIKSNFFKGVAIDVFQNESMQENNLDKLYSINENLNFIMTPHISGATYTSMARTEEFITKKIVRLFSK